MAKTLKRVAPPKMREPSHIETKRAIAAQTEDFLKLGGVIQSIPNGVSGQIWTPSRHIKLSKPTR